MSKLNNLIIGLGCTFLVVVQGDDVVRVKQYKSAYRCIKAAKKVVPKTGQSVICETLFHEEEFINIEQKIAEERK
jgi:hypothetical protein